MHRKRTRSDRVFDRSFHMPEAEGEFKVRMKDVVLFIKAHEIGGKTMYFITAKGFQSLLMVRSIYIGASGYWASLPPGREEEAEKIGQLIDKYLQSH
jgi:hypothetical protein